MRAHDCHACPPDSLDGRNAEHSQELAEAVLYILSATCVSASVDTVRHERTYSPTWEQGAKTQIMKSITCTARKLQILMHKLSSSSSGFKDHASQIKSANVSILEQDA